MNKYTFIELQLKYFLKIYLTHSYHFQVKYFKIMQRSKEGIFRFHILILKEKYFSKYRKLQF